MFISIDGPDGTGKSTAAKALVARLQQDGYRAILTAEPTDTPLGQQIRKELKGNSPDLLDMFIKDRDIHIKAFVEPYLADALIVVTDRYRYSTVCYQHLQGVPLEKLIALNQDFKTPDISFILYADDVSKLLDRISKRNQTTDFFEQKEILEQCSALYKLMPQYFPNDNFQMLNAEGTEGELLTEIYRIVREKLEHL